jgi:predicted enzyme related to lactoylglutathione lyase
MIAHWIEIPVTDFAHAAKFYETIFDAAEPIVNMAGGDVSFGYLPGARDVGSVCLVAAPGYVPSETSTVVYLSTGNDLAPALARVEGAGGGILLPKTHIDPQGKRAQFGDPDGNRIGRHSTQ